MEAKIITITPSWKKTDSNGWHTATLRAFDSYDDYENNKPKYERKIDSFDTRDMLKFDFEPNGKCIHIFPCRSKHNMLTFDESYGPTIEPTYKERYDNK